MKKHPKSQQLLWGCRIVLSYEPCVYCPQRGTEVNIHRMASNCTILAYGTREVEERDVAPW